MIQRSVRVLQHERPEYRSARPSLPNLKQPNPTKWSLPLQFEESVNLTASKRTSKCKNTLKTTQNMISDEILKFTQNNLVCNELQCHIQWIRFAPFAR